MTPQQAKWIWYPGDFEIYHALKLNLRREERGFEYPAFWRLDDCWHNVSFRKKCIFSKPETIYVTGTGMGYLSVDGRKYPYRTAVTLQPGEYMLEVTAAKIDGLPSIYVKAGEFSSDEQWEASCKTTEWLPCGCNAMYADENANPEIFKFSCKTIHPEVLKETQAGTLYDFGVETFARLSFSEISGEQPIAVFYGESETEALDTEYSYIRDAVPAHVSEFTFVPRAFRYIYIPKNSSSYRIQAEYEYIPFKKRGSFRCSNEKLNRIWETAAYTFHLNSREFFLDGIKRDRWVWSGDAYQSYLTNYYLFFDDDICKRTIIALRGKDPIEQHINTIMDYSFFWIMSIWDYYLYTKDMSFIRMIYGRMKSMMDYCQTRADQEGFVKGIPGDWIFIDWADIDKTGAVCAEQMLFAKSLETMAACASLMGEDGSGYTQQAKVLREKIDKFFWDPEQGAFIDSFESGRRKVTRHANIFAVIFGFADEIRKKQIFENVIMNDKIPQLTTPYFKFYELDAISALGGLNHITKSILDYWGGMLDLGATTFWEEYNPNEDFPAHYEMYSDKYGKSLCHAWGASPIYLLGKYFLGVKPMSAGFDEYVVSPQLGGLEWMEGAVPVPGGVVEVSMNASYLRVRTDCSGGTLVMGERRIKLPVGEVVELNLF